MVWQSSEPIRGFAEMWGRGVLRRFKSRHLLIVDYITISHQIHLRMETKYNSHMKCTILYNCKLCNTFMLGSICQWYGSFYFRF